MGTASAESSGCSLWTVAGDLEVLSKNFVGFLMAAVKEEYAERQNLASSQLPC